MIYQPVCAIISISISPWKSEKNKTARLRTMPESSPEHPIMRPIEHYVANATGELSEQQDSIEKALSRAIPVVVQELGAEGIDIFFLSEPKRVVRGQGVGGSTYHPNRAYIYIDPEHAGITEETLFATLLHEIHHCMRWRDPGLSKSLGEEMIFEGLACLYEEEHIGRAPIYATVALSDEHVAKAMRKLNSEEYDRYEWFFGSGSLEHWFGYTLGYRLCKDYSERTGRSAAHLVNTPASDILGK